MSNRDKMNDFLTNRWVSTHSPAAAATVSAGVSIAGGQIRPHLETLIYTIHNRGVSTGIAATVTVNVRVQSVAGTVVAAIPHFVASSTFASVQMENLGIPGKRGRGLDISMNTVVASLVQNVTAAGWFED